MSIFTKLFGDPNEKELKRLRPLVNEINELEAEISALTDEDLRGKTAEFKQHLENGEELDDLLPEAFAITREAGRRVLGMRHFDVQLLGGIVLHQGKIAEMRTGEGKTLVATLPAYLNSLTGKGVHIVTVNDYLAKRDADWMGQIYRFLGLNVGVILHHLEPHERKVAYGADITYGTNNEFGFDYLRDNMVQNLDFMVHRPFNYAIVDEVDNILIDEARTPLIISGQAEESTDKYIQFSRLVPRLTAEEDYIVEEKTKTVTLTEAGIEKMEKMAGVKNIYDENTFELTRYMEQALKAHVIFRRDRDYVVKDGEIIIVDDHTGRLMFGRRYSEGLHQAIEAKEGVKVQRENMTLATITFQNYFRLYPKLAGMTGTAQTEAEEFHKIYKLDVMTIPPNRPMIRRDEPDLIYKNEEAKFRAVVEEIKERHQIGQPVLVGTIAIETSEHLSDLLTRQGVPHQVLNAKFHERESAIIAQAGRSGAVTIATNMAGRGTDILLGGNPTGLVDQIVRQMGLDPAEATPEHYQEALASAEQICEEDRRKVVELGGLHILGTERHEARRIDNQLRGRSGRQGDPGSSRFYLSLQDELMRRFGTDKVAGLMDRLGMEEDMPIESTLASKFIENAQTKVEGYNFDIRKHVVEYDDIISKQRDVIYADRKKVLEQEDLKERILEFLADEIAQLVNEHTSGTVPENWEVPTLLARLEQLFPSPPDIDSDDPGSWDRDRIRNSLIEAAETAYEQKESSLGPELMRMLERAVMLEVVDRLWMEHIDSLDELREGVQLRSYAQRDPLVEFKREAFEMFDELKAHIQSEVVKGVFLAQVVVQQQAPDGTQSPERGPQPQELPAMNELAPHLHNLHTNKDQVVENPFKKSAPRAHPVAKAALADSNGKGNGSVQNPLPARGGLAAPPIASAARTGRKKVGRNELCPCGSGKKYKNCHGR